MPLRAKIKICRQDSSSQRDRMLIRILPIRSKENVMDTLLKKIALRQPRCAKTERLIARQLPAVQTRDGGGGADVDAPAERWIPFSYDHMFASGRLRFQAAEGRR